MALRLYIGEDAMARVLVHGLQARDADVLTVAEAARTGEPDDVQLAFGASQQRTLYTFNIGDLCRLHEEYLAETKHHAGIIVVPRRRYSIGEQIRGLMTLVSHDACILPRPIALLQRVASLA